MVYLVRTTTPCFKKIKFIQYMKTKGIQQNCKNLGPLHKFFGSCTIVPYWLLVNIDSPPNSSDQ